MIDGPTNGKGGELAEQALRDQLARCDAAIATARPILRGLVANEDPALFSDAMIAGVRGMMFDLAAQLLSAQAAAAEVRDHSNFLTEHQEGLAQALSRATDLLAQAHVVVLEAQFAERLRARSGADPVLPPLMQQAAAGSDPELAELATAVLTAQSRFVKQVSEMKLPLRELPADLFDQALGIARQLGGTGMAEAERRLRAAHDEATSREDFLARFVSRAGEDGADVLSLERAGLAVFATALAAATRQPRAQVMIAFADTQLVRLALSLRAAGFTQQTMELHFQLIHPGHSLPLGLEIVPTDRAAALLSAADAVEASA